MSDRSDPLFAAEQAAQQAWRSSDVTQDRVAQEDAKWTQIWPTFCWRTSTTALLTSSTSWKAGSWSDEDGLAWERLPIDRLRTGASSDSFRRSAWEDALETAPQPLRVCGFCQHSPPP